MALGLGVAVVNHICRLPRGVTSVPILDLEGPRYHAVRRADAEPRPDLEALWAEIAAAEA